MSYEGEGGEKHHHHHHGRRSEEEEYQPRRDQDSYGGDGGYNQQGGGYGGGSSYDQGDGYVQTDVYQEVQPTNDGRIEETKVKMSRHKHEGEAAGIGGLAAGAFAMYEAHEAKKDPAHAARHKLEEEIAGGAAVGAEGFALYEHHEKKGSKEELKVLEESSGGEKKHHWF